MTGAGLTVLPAVDVAAGRAVRLVRGKAVDPPYGDPLDVALGYQRAGARWLHLVDVDAAFGQGDNRDLLRQLVRRLDVPVQLSGGVRDDAQVAAALATGAARVVIGTAGLEDPDRLRAAIRGGGDRVAVGLDVRGQRLAPRGWPRPGGDLLEALRLLDAAGCCRYVVTDVGRDGTLDGPNLDLLRQVCAATDRPVVASGGVGSLSDLRSIADVSGVEGVVVGGALAAGAFTLAEALVAADR